VNHPSGSLMVLRRKMPTYAYQCKKCEHYFEKILKIAERDDPVSQPCSECQGEIYKRLEIGGLASDSKTPMRRAGSEWNDRLKQIKKGSGRVNTINT
jgi:putative FmdB family regulatory protein